MDRTDGDRQAADTGHGTSLHERLRTREHYLETLAEVERRLLECAPTDDLYAAVLPLLLETPRADRVYVFENSTRPAGDLLTNHVAEVVAEGVEPQIGNPALQDVPWEPAMTRWLALLQAGDPVIGSVSDFPDGERAILEPQGVRSLLVLPLTVDDDLFGFVGFDDCRSDQPWDDAAVQLLRAAAGALSAALTRRRAMSSLWKSKNRYRDLYRMLRLMADTVPDLIWAKDLDRRYTFANTALCEHLLNAVGTDEPLGKTDLYFAERERDAHPDDPGWHTFGEVCRDSDAVVMETNRPGRFDESGNVRGEHMVLDVHKAPLLDDDGRLIGTVGSARDVTGERRVAERLRHSEARMKAILDALPDILLLLRSDGSVLNCHAPDGSVLADSPERVIGRPLADVLPAEVATKMADGIAKAVADGHLVSHEYSLRIQGEHRRFETRIVPCEQDEALVMVRDVTERYRRQKELKEGARKLRTALAGTVKAMGTIVELRDPYTAGHERNVTEIAAVIAVELGMDAERREGLLLASQVHDIGKISIPAEILSKPGVLTEAEMTLVRQHPGLGRDILAGVDFEWPVADIVHQHHERLDGSGYPQGLTGDQILFEARILAVADVLEAMAAHRPYRAALGIGPALEELRGGAGVLYDADVVAACVRAWEADAISIED
ncbi:MAG: PAS domain-containing protein [Actinobacteria bacterium]|nr:PAS domain-containing protein [Actinomycetota bacterium]